MSIVIIIGIVLLVLGLWFGGTWLMTKGAIWVMLELFDINWYDKFWPVFVALLIISAIFSGGRYYNKGGQ